MLPWFITLAAPGTLVPSVDSAHAGLHALARIAGDRLLFFRLVGSEAQVVLAGTRPEASLVARALSLALRSLHGASLAPAVIESAGDLAALTVELLHDPYSHEIMADPIRWPGSAFADLVGARTLPDFDRQRLASRLPVGALDDILSVAGVLTPAGDDDLCSLGPEGLVEVGRRVMAAPSALRGRAETVVRTRALVVQQGSALGMGSSPLARALGIHRATVVRLRERPLAPGRLVAARLQAALVSTSRRSARRAPRPSR